MTHTHRPGGRRPPALGRGARRRCGRGRPGSVAVRPDPPAISPVGSRRARPRCSDCPGGAIFVKAVGAELNPESPEFHRREAVVSAALPPAPRVPAAARRLRRRRLGGAGLRGDRRRAAGASVGPAASCEAAVQRARCAARRPHAQPRRRTRRLRPTGCSPSSAAGPSWRPWPSRPRGSTRGAPATWTAWPSSSRGGPTQWQGRRCSTATCAPTTCWSPAAASCSSTGRTPVSARRSSTSSPGRPRWSWRAVRLPKSCSPFPRPGRRSTATSSRRWSPRSAGSWCRHSLQPAPPGLPTLRAFQAAQGAVALAWLRAPHGLVTPGAPSAGTPVGSAACASDCRSPTSPPTRHPVSSSTGWSPWRPRRRRPATTRSG